MGFVNTITIGAALSFAPDMDERVGGKCSRRADPGAYFRGENFRLVVIASFEEATARSAKKKSRM